MLPRLVDIFFTGHQDKETVEDDLNIKTVYKTMWQIVKLRRMSLAFRRRLHANTTLQTSRHCASFISSPKSDGLPTMLSHS